MSRRARLFHPIHPTTIAIGVDVAKDTFEARALAGDGRLGARLRFRCTADGFESLLAYAASSMKKLGAEDFMVAMEPTGHYGEPLARWLMDRSVKVRAVSPLKTARSKELYDGTTRKTDEKDAKVIADLCRRGLSTPWRRRSGPFAELRVLSRRREQLVVQRARSLNRVQRHLDELFPELRGLFAKMFSKSMLWLLSVAPTPAKVRELGLLQLTAGLRKASRGRLGQARAEALLEAAHRSVGITDDTNAHEFALQQLLEELRHLEGQLSAVDAAMEKALAKVPYGSRLLTIPGLAAVSAATLLGELGDLRDYRVAKQVIKMIGLDLVESSSGAREGHRHISHRGRRYARQMLYMVVIQPGPPGMKARRDRLLAAGKPPKKAMVANMCALLRIMFALARDDVDFDASLSLVSEVRLAS
jgi:transposase